VPLPARSGRRPQNIAGVSNLFAGIAEYLLMALSVVRGISPIWSLSEHSGHRSALPRVGSVAFDPKRVSAV
jgi:hypothetical protein